MSLYCLKSYKCPCCRRITQHLSHPCVFTHFPPVTWTVLRTTCSNSPFLSGSTQMLPALVSMHYQLIHLHRLFSALMIFWKKSSQASLQCTCIILSMCIFFFFLILSSLSLKGQPPTQCLADGALNNCLKNKWMKTETPFCSTFAFS